MRIIAVDDEPMALESLVSSILEESPDADVKAFYRPEDALLFAENARVDVAFLDINMRGVTGVEIARQIKRLHPQANLVFTTGYSEYAITAFQLDASGYLLKPITPEDIRHALDNLRYPVPHGRSDRLWIQAFGNFEAFLDGKPIRFQYDKTKEMLAYLVDRKGSLCSNGEIMAALWEDERHISYLKRLRKDLTDVLRGLGCGNVIEKQRGGLRIVKQEVDCDYFQWLDGQASGINAYRGEYMTQYSWGEPTHGALFSSARTQL